MTSKQVPEVTNEKKRQSKVDSAAFMGRSSLDTLYEEVRRLRGIRAEQTVKVARLQRGLRLMARRHMEVLTRELSEHTGEPPLTGPDVDGPAADFMREVMTEVDAPGEDGGLLDGPDA